MVKIRAARVENVTVGMTDKKSADSISSAWTTNVVFGWNFKDKQPTKQCSLNCVWAEASDCLKKIQQYYGTPSLEQLKGKTVRIVVLDDGMLCGVGHPTEDKFVTVYGFCDGSKEEYSFEELEDFAMSITTSK